MSYHIRNVPVLSTLEMSPGYQRERRREFSYSAGSSPLLFLGSKHRSGIGHLLQPFLNFLAIESERLLILLNVC
jgi:hypothetical protein